MATLGKMSLWALVDSSIDEASGLDEFIQRLDSVSSDDKRWLSAFTTSIRARLMVAQIKIEKDEATTNGGE